MTRLEAYTYLIDKGSGTADEPGVYRDEWSGAGLFEALAKVRTMTGEITKEWLDSLLKEASEF